MTEREALQDVVKAWDSLREGDYPRDIIETWLADKMFPAINRARRALDEQMSGLPAREVEAGKPGQPEGAGNAADLSRDDSGTLRMQHVPGCKAAFTKDDADCDLCGRF